MGEYYERKELNDIGRQFCLAMLIDCLREGEPFITYGRLSDVIVQQTHIEKIFDLHCGSVAGIMMYNILEKYPDAPPINSLVANQDGIPGEGVEEFISAAYPRQTKGDWLSLTRAEKLELLKKIRADIRAYPKWDKVLKKLYGKTVEELLPPKEFTENDGKPGYGPGGGGEGPQHLKLKKWVANNPTKIGIPQRAWLLGMEYKLLSGDIVDVVFTDGNNFWVVEVKSKISKEPDLRKGLYQCVKYYAVLTAQQLPVKSKVTPILITEKKLSPELEIRRKQLGIKIKIAKVN